MTGPTEAAAPAPVEGDAYGFAGLSTRGALVATLDGRLQAPGEAAPWSLLLVGIDHLGQMNETFGFEVVDRVIADIARRLRARAPFPDLIARFSGGKFAILATSCATAEAAGALAQAICADVRMAPVETSAGPMPISVTVGGVLGGLGPTTRNAVLANVQEALDKAKRQARGSFQLYTHDPALEALRRANQRAAEEIVRAIWDRRIVLALQPVVNARTRIPVFYEALARIQPLPGGAPTDAGLIAEAAERLGLIGALDRHVLAHAADALRRDPALHLSVNVSPTSVADHEWLSAFDRAFSADIAGRLIVELTESAAVQDLHATRSFVEKARARCARVAIDDFGAGSTSFRILRSLGVDMIKIDGGFVKTMADSADDRAFVTAMIRLARQLGITVVAEWVWNEEVAALLLAEGCDLFQGALTGLAEPYAPKDSGEDPA